MTEKRQLILGCALWAVIAASWLLHTYRFAWNLDALYDANAHAQRTYIVERNTQRRLEIMRQKCRIELFAARTTKSLDIEERELSGMTEAEATRAVDSEQEANSTMCDLIGDAMNNEQSKEAQKLRSLIAKQAQEAWEKAR